MTIRIVSDGTAHGTRIYTQDGVELNGNITKLEIDPIVGGERIFAKVTFYKPQIDIQADGRALVHGMEIMDKKPDA